MYSQAPVLFHRFFDSNGNPLVGGKLYTYVAGTTTPQATFAAATGGANANPIILDANGYVGGLFLGSNSYKFSLYDSNDVLIKTVDNISASSGSSGGSSGGFGDKNYITNSDAENDTVGWSTYKDAAAAIPVDGTGGASTLVFTTSSANALRGSASFLLSKGLSNQQGEGVSYGFIIDSADQGKVLTISADCMLVSGIYSGGSGTTKSDLIVYIYDTTNNTLIEPVGINIDPGIINNKGSVYATFQTNSNSTSYRLIFHVSTTSSLGYVMAFDNVSVGPKNLSKGAFLGDWTAFTPTWTNLTVGNATQRFFYKVVGDELQIRGSLVLGSTSSVSGQIKMTIPTQFSVDISKLMLSAYARVGTMTVYDGVSTSVGLVLMDNTSTSTVFFVQKDGVTVKDPLTNTSYTWGTSDEIEILDMVVPISGKSSSMTLSSDAGTRAITFRATKSGTQSITSGADTKITSLTVTDDSHSQWDSTNNRYVFVESGKYLLGIHEHITGTSASIAPSYKINGGSTVYCGSVGSLSSDTRSAGTDEIKVNAGDYIEFYGYGLGTSPVLQTDSSFWLSKVQGPQQIAASESVNLRYTSTAGDVVATSSTVFKPTTKAYDTHSSYNTSTGVFTAPMSGVYRISGSINTQAAALTTSQAFFIEFYKNGSTLVGFNYIIGNGASNTWPVTCSSEINLLAGETLQMNIFTNKGSTGLLSTTAGQNQLTISRIGN